MIYESIDRAKVIVAFVSVRGGNAESAGQRPDCPFFRQMSVTAQRSARMQMASFWHKRFPEFSCCKCLNSAALGLIVSRCDKSMICWPQLHLDYRQLLSASKQRKRKRSMID